MTIDLEKRITNNYRSNGERTIAKFLNQYGLSFVYETDIYLQDKNKSYIWHPDFYLPEYHTIIEYFGMNGDKKYDQLTQRKKRIYYDNNYHLIPVYEKTLKKDFKTYILKSIYNNQNNKLANLQRKIGYK